MFRAAVLRFVAAGVASAALFAIHIAASPFQARERTLYVSVFDSSTHQPVTGLTAKDFVVREDGVQREVLRVSPASGPMPVALLIDNTQEATNAVADIRRAVRTFLNTAEGLGPIALVSFADRPTILVDYTTNQKNLQDAAQRIFATPASGATLLDAVRDTARGLQKRESDRAAIVVLATEGTEFSTLYHADVLDALAASGASLNAIVLVTPGASLMRDEARNRATVLDRGPRESGGARFDVLASSAFDTAMRDVAGILKSQYRVVYAPPDSLIPPEKVEISTARPGVEAHGARARGDTKK